MDEINLGFVATGARNSVYARNLRRQFGDRVRIAAVCDVDEGRALDFKRDYGQEDTRVYTDYGKLIEENGDLDGLLVAPPNHLHEEVAVMAMRRGMNLLLEKPLAHTAESCMNIARAYTASESRVTMGFVLRYTPFYRTIMDMLMQGKVGRIVTLSADEVVGPVLSTAFLRTWRANADYSGDLLLEKCCHDLDLINAMVGVEPVRAAAFARRDHFLPQEGLGPRCSDCAIKDTCSYSTVLWAREVEWREDDGEYEYIDFDNDLCVYNDGNTNVDRQSNLIEYQDGILVHFNVTLGGPTTKRTISIVGTEGRIMGDFLENRILYYPMFDKPPEEIQIQHERSGHGGGDSVITRSFMESLENPDHVPEASFKDGLKSALLAFLCDRARDEGRFLPAVYLGELDSIRD